MFRITSQLCEVFDCTDEQLETSGILNNFNVRLKDNPDQLVSQSIEWGEVTNSEISERFFESYMARKINV